MLQEWHLVTGSQAKMEQNFKSSSWIFQVLWSLANKKKEEEENLQH